MTDLVVRTAQSLHAEWCEQMRKKGFHGPGEECNNYYHRGLMPKRSHPKDCTKGHPNLIPWPDLPESRRQEYLATAKAVLPEIVETIFTDAMDVVEKTKVAHEFHGSVFHEPSKNGKELVAALLYLRDRRLEELVK